jgi:hypothetical protein
MSSGTTAVVIVLAIIVMAAIIAFAMASRRRRLQRRFGPDYDRVVAERDSRVRAEAELTERQRRVLKLDIQPRTEAARSRYLTQWQAIQEQFVDSPRAAVTDAYTLATTVMRERGYPTTDDDQVMADRSVDHAPTLEHFRAAQGITRDVAQGSAATEDLRQPLIHYRALFADLLGDRVQASTSTARLNGRAWHCMPGSPVSELVITSYFGSVLSASGLERTRTARQARHDGVPAQQGRAGAAHARVHVD